MFQGGWEFERRPRLGGQRFENLEPLDSGLSNELPGCVGGDDRGVGIPGRIEDRLIETPPGVGAAPVFRTGFRHQVSSGEAAVEPGIDRRLLVPFEHFQGDRRAIVQGQQIPDQRSLESVGVRIVMFLADHHDLGLEGIFDHAVPFDGDSKGTIPHWKLGIRDRLRRTA